MALLYAVSYTHLDVYKRQVLGHALIEAYGKNAQPGQQFQFLRQGYYCRDNKDTDQGNMVFHEIVGLKDSFKKTLEK